MWRRRKKKWSGRKEQTSEERERKKETGEEEEEEEEEEEQKVKEPYRVSHQHKNSYSSYDRDLFAIYFDFYAFFSLK